MLKVATLASGSSGNCLVVSDGRIHILIDAGISARRITTGLKGLGIDPAALTAVLITHEHADHISGLPVLCRQTGADIYTAEPTARQICRRTAGLEERLCVFEAGERFAIGDLVVGTFPTSHDCARPVGYTVSDGRVKLGLCTDLGTVTDEVLAGLYGSHLLVGEFNHDVDMLRAGPYPAYLKERVLGDRGHLSNEAGAALAARCVQWGANRVVMAHLSQENNRPSLARQAAEGAFARIGAAVGRDVRLETASRSEPGDWWEVEP